jgi:putative ABC transport system permease protein
MISGVSLLVGGIGIMNIMFASIASRIRELGIRKAVGASDGEIFLQILIESVVIAGLGGLMGLLASLALVRLIAGLSPTDNPPIVTGTALLFAFSCCVTIGLLAGMIPALKAARLDPISALRYE